MKLLHLSDLHLGKIIYGISLIESGDQQALIDNIIDSVDELEPDALIIAGDIYDRSNPPEGAVELFEQLLNRLMESNLPTLIIGGNHDSIKRLSYLNDTLKDYNIHIADELSAELQSVTLEDEYGQVVFWLMPYAYPAIIAHVLDNPEIKYKDYDSAIRAFLERQNIDFNRRNVLIAHQNVVQNGSEAERGGSESFVGAVGGIDADAFADFDYTALGHIHAGYHIGEGNVRYCGTPLCYHFDETRQKDKGALFVEIGEKGDDIKVTPVKFEPLHPLVVLKGTYEELKNSVSNLNGTEYVKIALTDTAADHDVYANLRSGVESRGARLLEIISEYTQKALSSKSGKTESKNIPIDALFDEFYYSRRGEHLEEKDLPIISHLAQILEQTDFSEQQDREEAAKRLLDFVKEGGQGK